MSKNEGLSKDWNMIGGVSEGILELVGDLTC